MNEISRTNGSFVTVDAELPSGKTDRLTITLRDLAGMIAGALFGIYVLGL